MLYIIIIIHVMRSKNDHMYNMYKKIHNKYRSNGETTPFLFHTKNQFNLIKRLTSSFHMVPHKEENAQ